ncbi:hypothetical protein [Microbacterium sp. E-13]|uniref:hypothetical protein n=1 Tax=Microbacterium sp. E-13 TaxID=3404048 RepID=UPI003CE69F46
MTPIDSTAVFHAQRLALELADLTDHTARTMRITAAISSYADVNSQAAFVIALPLAILAVLDKTVAMAGDRVQVNLDAANDSLRNGIRKKRDRK